MTRGPLSSAVRCPGCKMQPELCICALLPRLETRTRVTVLMHSFEDKKTTSTGRLAARCLVHGRVVVRGRKALPFPDELWEAGTQPLLLYPHEEAGPLEAWTESERPITLLVPDGTWPQARRMRRRVPGLADVPCVRLWPEAPSAYGLRASPRADGLATIEAIALALGVLEGPAAQAALEHVFSVMVQRTWQSRGRGPAAPAAQGADRQSARDLV